MSALPHGAPAAIPSGTVTFVFTDIEGSTVRWDRDRAAMEDAVRRHDCDVREAIAAHDGFVFKTIGDAFCAAFARPEDALAAVTAAQHALALEDFAAVGGLRIRVALHTGTADERDRDYFGPAVNRVARLLAIAHGGQVLLSGVTSDLVRGSLPAEATLRDLGEHRLKDLSRPEHVFQLVAPDLPSDFPPLRSLEAFPNNLPLHLTSFVGREAEIGRIASLVREHRLVTLLGSGGIGKTRTSLQVAANVLEEFPDGAWFVELAPLSSGTYLSTTIAQAVRASIPSEGDPLESLVRLLGTKKTLLVFDNCEHLLDDVASAVATISRECPGVHMLASSRQALGIGGEETFRLPSLPIPADGESKDLTAARATEFAAVALFADRARASDNRFDLSDENAPIVADICRRLDGIALAIELAAARVKMLSPHQLRDRLDERFRVLTGGSRDVLPRQQTLRALIDWSYDLLDDRERALFRRIAIFVNGFTIEGSAAVGSADDLDEFDLLDVLASLVDKSLVLAEPGAGAGASRYRLLESTRAYAREKLVGSGDRDRIAGRHLAYFRGRFAAMKAEWERTARASDAIAAFEAELDDLRFALDGATASGEAHACAELLAAIERAWEALGLHREGIARIDASLACLAESDALLQAKLCAIAGALLVGAGNLTRAAEMMARAVSYARSAGDDATSAFVLGWDAFVAMRAGDLDGAQTLLFEAESHAKGDVSPRLRSMLLEMRASLGLETGDLDATARAYEQLRDENRARGNARNEYVNVHNLAEIECRRGRPAEAVAVVRELLPVLRRGSDKMLLADVLVSLANYSIAVGDRAAASAAADEAVVTLASREPDNVLITVAIETLALVAVLAGEMERGAALAGYASAAFARIGYKRERTEHATYERLSDSLAPFEPEAVANHAARGAALTPQAAIALARAATRAVPPPAEVAGVAGVAEA